MLAALTLRADNWRRVWHRAATLAGVTSSLLAVIVLLAGTAYLHGALFTTLARKTDTGILDLNPARPPEIVTFTWDRIGLVVITGAVAMIVALAVRKERPSFPLLALLVVAGLLVTVEALHLHDLTSVNKHDDFGVWFTAIAAGYALARGAELMTSRHMRAACVAWALLSVPITFYLYGNHGPISRPDDLADASNIVPYLQVNSSNRYLLGGLVDRTVVYDYHLSISWWRVIDDDYVKYPIPGRGGNASGSAPGRLCTSLAPGCVYLQGPEAARAAISAHWFAVVSFVGQYHLPIDTVELDTVSRTPGYLLVSTAGGPTYIYAPDFPNQEMAYRSPERPYSLPYRVISDLAGENT